MSKTIAIIFGFLLLNCSKTKHPIEGIWEVNSNYYKATYKISQEKNRVVGRVIYYNDGTTVLNETGTDKDIFLFNLKQKNNTYIDAVSGATNTQTTTIKIKHADSLEVTSYILKKPITEFWIKNSNNYK